MKLPKHKCGLYLEHNTHKDYYEDVAKELEQDHLRDSFKNEEAKQRALATDEVWTLQWYPNTPVGFIKVAAPTLEELLCFALEVEAKDNATRATESEGAE